MLVFKGDLTLQDPLDLYTHEILPMVMNFHVWWALLKNMEDTMNEETKNQVITRTAMDAGMFEEAYDWMMKLGVI